MARVNDSERVACTQEEMEGFLDRFFAALPGRGDATRLRVRLPLRGDSALETDVTARIVDLANAGGGHVLSIEWEPADGGPFPRFRGTLTCLAEPDRACTLSLAGEYEPPGGLAGRVFDVPVGAFIARKTARELLERLRASAESELRPRS